jgi:hypothetical protein
MDEGCPTWRPRRGDEIHLMSLTVASRFLDLTLTVLNWGREGREKDEGYLTWRPRRGEEILLMSLTVASCFLDLILSVIPARRSDLKCLSIVQKKRREGNQ